MPRYLSEHLHLTRIATGAVLLMVLSSVPAQAQLRPSSSNVGYIDNAIPGNILFLRADASNDINRPDRAQYIYFKSDSRVNNQDLYQYAEAAFGNQLSAFVQVNEHFVDPTTSANDKGIGDTVAGFKWAFLYSDEQVATFQLKTYFPTGDPNRFLGAGHASIEPGLLLFQRLTDQLTFEGQFRGWIPVDNSDQSGSILEYGAGLGYRVFQTEQCHVTPVVEFVGWTVLGGKESGATGISQDAAGDTIINAKMGVRLGFGRFGDFYAGYGRALTGDVWYKNTGRLEYRLTF
jgi:hypothetical protein